MRTIQYKVDKVENGIRYLTVYLNGKILTELECFNYTYFNVEEVQHWLDDNGYGDKEFGIKEII